jgi:malonate transporter
MNIGGLFGALTPVFFVLALGYLAGKRNTFDADQSAGLSKLALTFALPASLFVSMTDIPKDLLLQQGRLVLALILSHAGLFVVAWLLLRMVKSLSGTASIIYALMLATSATPVFGLAVLEPLLGRTSGGAVGLVALAINLTVPPAVILLEMDAATKHQQGTTDPSKPSAIVTGLNAGVKSPLLWLPSPFTAGASISEVSVGPKGLPTLPKIPAQRHIVSDERPQRPDSPRGQSSAWM